MTVRHPRKRLYTFLKGLLSPLLKLISTIWVARTLFFCQLQFRPDITCVVLAREMTIRKQSSASALLLSYQVHMALLGTSSRQAT